MTTAAGKSTAGLSATPRTKFGSRVDNWAVMISMLTIRR
jgi:hypothetical protein